MDWLGRLCADHSGHYLYHAMTIRRSNHSLLLVALAVIVQLMSCLSERELPPPPDDLEERTKTFLELEKQLGRLKQANAEETSVALRHEDYRVRERAARHMGNLGQSSKHFLTELLQALKDKEKSVRLEAGIALGKIGDERAIEPLIIALVDEDPQVRLRIWKALKKFGTSAITALIAHFKRTAPTKNLAYKNEAGEKRLLSQEIAGRFSTFGKRAVPFLMEALEYEDEWVRRKAVIVLGRLGKKAKDALPLLTTALEKEQGIADKIRVVTAIKEIGNHHPSVIPALKKATKSKNKKLRIDAQRLLKEFKKESKKESKKKGKKAHPRPNSNKPSPDPLIDDDFPKID